jgi:hypothetical protein
MSLVETEDALAARLEALPPAGPGLMRGVDFSLGASRTSYAAGSCTVVDASSGCRLVDPIRVASFVASAAAFFAYSERATVVLALAAKKKVLVRSRPLRMSDVNGGVTFLDERLVIVWRFDADFWKVLLHELVHLMTGDTDEARVEATALSMWSAASGVVPAAQREFTARLADRVESTDFSATNEWLYTRKALCYLDGRTDCDSLRPPPRRPSTDADEVFRSTAPATGL